MIRRPLLFALLGLLATPAMAGRRLPTPDVVEDAAAFATTDREKAARLLEDAATNEDGATASERPTVLLHAGEQRRLLGETDAAHKWFREAEGQGSGAVRSAARLGLALLDAYDGVDARVAGLLSEASDKECLPTQNADRYLLLAKYAASRSDTRKQRDYSKRAVSAARDDEDVLSRIQRAIALLDAAPADSDVVLDGPTGEASEEGSRLDRAEAALDDGDEAKARRIADQVAASPADEAEAEAAKYFQRRLDGAAIQSDRIGVLLPLSGKYGVAGNQVKDALELGYGAQSRTLVFRDSGSTAESAVKALDALAFEEGVIAVVGPLLTDESAPVVAAAEAMRLPLLSLSQAIEVEESSRFLVQGQVTQRAQVTALLDHVIGVEELRTFAIFAPDNNYGHTAAEAFQAEAEAREATVTVVEFYDPVATDLIPFASKLGRKDYEARAREFRDLKESTEEKGGNPDRVVLPPELDFEALFVPENHKRVPIACAALAYEEFPIGDFQVERDGPTIPLLGLSGWDHPDLVTRGGLYTRGSFFVDSFWRAEPDEDPFVVEYRADFGRSPTALEANVHDVGLLLGAAAASGAKTRTAFLEALLSADVEGGVSGLSGVAENGAAERDFHVLTMNKDEIVEVPAPSTPDE
ncbi:MAG: penicillin-binding protein activator [Proteobacteria bacterium]|nr:penicillin-binding protein activator [Pseudomonadota bacterium]